MYDYDSVEFFNCQDLSIIIENCICYKPEYTSTENIECYRPQWLLLQHINNLEVYKERNNGWLSSFNLL